MLHCPSPLSSVGPGRWQHRDLEGGRLRLHTRRAGYSGVSFAVENRSHLAPGEAAGGGGGGGCSPPARGRSVEFTLDCGGSANAMSHTGALRATVVVAPGEVGGRKRAP